MASAAGVAGFRASLDLGSKRMTYSVFYRERVAQAFDFAGITTEWVPCSSRPLRRAGHGNACACGLIPSLRNKSYSTGIIDARP